MVPDARTSIPAETGAAGPPDGSDPRPLVHLRAAGTSVLLDFPGDAVPVVVHWGEDFGDVEALAGLALAAAAAPVQNEPDTVSVLTVLPEQSRGWTGAPGLSGHRAGAGWSARFTVTDRVVDAVPDSAGRPAGGRVRRPGGGRSSAAGDADRAGAAADRAASAPRAPDEHRGRGL